MFFEFLHPWKKNEKDELPEMPKPNSDNSEGGYVAEGWGNGSLHPHVVRNPENYWNGGHSEDDFYVGFDFHYWDWEALFAGVLNCPEWEPYVEGEDIMEREKREYARFQQCTSDYPLLGRIFDMYQDAEYRADEVSQLREQCLRLQSRTNHAEGWRALAKLILACDKALERKLGLLLISD